MRWDYKLVNYLLLTYFIYGVINWLSLSDFIVPLPLSFIFAPLIAFTFIIKTKPSIHTFLYLGIPLLMMKDLIINYNEIAGITLSIISLLSWMTLGGLLFKIDTNNLFVKASAIGLLVAPLLLVGNQYISLFYLFFLLLTSFKILQIKKHNLTESLERSLLLFTFINALFLLNEASNWVVS